MEQRETFPYYVDEYLQCVELPYGNRAFSMVAILPAENTPLEQFIAYLDDEVWQNIVEAMKWHQEKVWLKLPRFKVECEMRLNESVENVGMKTIFDPDNAAFSNISTIALYVTLIQQNTFVEVNEEGTEAAAVTAIMMAPTAIGPDPNEPVRFFANRPFLYLIKEKSTGVILFIGRMDDPKE